MTEEFLGGRVIMHAGDCREVLRTLEDNSIDSVVTDPPYHLQSIVKRFGGSSAAPAQFGSDGAFRRASAGFMSQTWDGGDIAFNTKLWAEVMRVLKPGAYIVAFAASRGYHRMACAIEDAGFITHPMIGWVFATGFPKATRVKSQDWDGWRYGTQSLKPALEPIYMGQKPFSEKTGTENILRWGTGALNIDGCRIGGVVETWPKTRSYASGQMQPGHSGKTQLTGSAPNGRWPSNLVHDGGDEVLACFPETTSGSPGVRRKPHSGADRIGQLRNAPINGDPETGIGDSGSAARFFYSSKADGYDRIGSRHPTIKPLDLMQWLVRLVTPPRGCVLDLFAGTGSTGEAAYREGFSAVLIEREEEYLADIRRRMGLIMAGKESRKHVSVKARGIVADAGPLFGMMNE